MGDSPQSVSGPGGAAPLAMSSVRRWSIVILLFTASLINYLDRATVSIALPLISKDLHLGPATEGVLLSAFFWSYALMQVPIGWCSDRLNLRWLYAGAFVLWSLAQGLTGLAAGLTALMLFRILLGVGESIYLPGGSKIVSLLFPLEERGLPSGLFDFGTRTGLLLEGILIPYLLVHYGWRKTFLVVGFLALVWLIPWLAATPPLMRAERAALSPAGRRLEVTRVLKLLRSRNLLGICLGFFCFDYYWYLLVLWLPNYLVTVRGFTILKAGVFYALPFLVFGLCQPLGGWIADRLVRAGFDKTRTRKGIVTFAFLTGLLLIPAARVESANAAVALIMGACLVGLSTGNLLVILHGAAPPSDVGVWTGYENFFGNVAGILAPLITGYTVARTGSYAPAFALSAIVLVAGLIAYWFIVGDLGRPE